MPKKINKNIMLILITLIIFFTIIITIFILKFTNKNQDYKPINKEIVFENINSDINDLYIYGTHLNIKGTVPLMENLSSLNVVIINERNEEIILDTFYDVKEGNINYKLSEKLNTGLFLDSFDEGEYKFALKTIITNEDKDSDKYYRLNNTTDNKETTYYTITKNKQNKKIVFNTKANTLTMNVTENEDNVYDIAIDAGHGGRDPGACYYGKCETDYTLDLAYKLKELLEKEGLKVMLTRDSNEGTFPTYGEGGRVVKPHDAKVKYLFSFHLNSAVSNGWNNGWNGVEVYCPYNTDTTLASDIATYITSYTGTDFSKKEPYRMDKGVYTRTFRQNEIDSFFEEIDNDGYERYNIDLLTNYYYLIRETGGYMTGAYTDGRDGKLVNPYVKSNVGIESYIMEIGYISNPIDIENIDAKKDKYVEAVKEAIIHNIYK